MMPRRGRDSDLAETNTEKAARSASSSEASFQHELHAVQATLS